MKFICRYHLWRGYWKAKVLGSWCNFCTRIHKDESLNFYSNSDDIKNWRTKVGNCIKPKEDIFSNGDWDQKIFLSEIKKNTTERI